jgi:hypothetical protein
MSGYVGKDGECSLWVNTEKRAGQHDASGTMWISGKPYPFNINRENLQAEGRNPRSPTHTGYVDVNGTHNRVSLWKQEELKTENHPRFSGKYQVMQDNYDIALWDRKEGDNPKGPDYRGLAKINEQPYNKNSASKNVSRKADSQVNDGFSSAAKSNFDLDDDIPF